MSCGFHKLLSARRLWRILYNTVGYIQVLLNVPIQNSRQSLIPSARLREAARVLLSFEFCDQEILEVGHSEKSRSGSEIHLSSGFIYKLCSRTTDLFTKNAGVNYKLAD